LLIISFLIDIKVDILISAQHQIKQLKPYCLTHL